MNTESKASKLIHAEETHAIIGAAMEVLNQIGHGFHEKPYENALVVELELRGIPFMQQPVYPITYKGRSVGTFIPDLVCFEKWWLTPRPLNGSLMWSGDRCLIIYASQG